MRRKRYRIYGLGVETDFPFAVGLPESTSPSDFSFLADADLGMAPSAAGNAVYSSALRSQAGVPLVELVREGEREFLRFAHRAEFSLEPDLVRYPVAADARTVESLFLSSVLAYILECRGVVALHGSAVEVAGAATAFVGASGVGKSTLAAAFVAAGYRILTDDVLAVGSGDDEFRVRAAYPGVKLNPDVGTRLAAMEFERAQRVHPAEEKRFLELKPAKEGFCAEDRRLDTVFLVRRTTLGGGRARILHASRRSAVVELLRATFTPNLVEAKGLSERRLEKLGELAESVQVFCLEPESDLEKLSETVDAVVRKMATR